MHTLLSLMLIGLVVQHDADIENRVTASIAKLRGKERESAELLRREYGATVFVAKPYMFLGTYPWGPDTIGVATFKGINADERLFSALQSFPHLIRLELFDCDVGDTSIANVAKLRSITCLNVGWSRLSPMAFSKICTELPRLERLFADSIGLVDDNLACLGSAKHIRSLSLSGNPISDSACVHLKTAGTTSLDLSGTLVTDKGVATILSERDGLYSLSLARTRVTDKCIEDILRLPSSVSQLDLSDTAIGETGIIRLGSIQHLQRIDVRKTAVTAEAIDKLRELLPDCIVDTDH